MPKAPTDYSKAVIYKIEHLEKPELVYVGSTTDFTKRKYQHKKNSNDENSKAYNFKLYQMIRSNNGFESFKMMIICEFPCKNKIELVIEEEKNRKELQATLNSCSAYNTVEDTKKQDKHYRETNKEKLKEYFKEYRKINKEQLKEYYEKNKEKLKKDTKQYYIENKPIILEKLKLKYETNNEKLKEKAKDYRTINKEKINEKSKEQITCECGSIFRKFTKSRHEKTIKHCKFLQQF